MADVFQLRMKRLPPAHAEGFISEGPRRCELLRDCFSGTPAAKIIRGSRFTQSAIAGPKLPSGSSEHHGTRSKPLGQEIPGLQRFREKGVEGLAKYLHGEQHLENETSNKIPSNEIRSRGLNQAIRKSGQV